MKILSISTHDLSSDKTTLHYPAKGLYFLRAWEMYREAQNVIKESLKKDNLLSLNLLTLRRQTNGKYHYIMIDHDSHKLLHLMLDAEICMEVIQKLTPVIKRYLADEHNSDINVFIHRLKDVCNSNPAIVTSSTYKIQANLDTGDSTEQMTKHIDATLVHGRKVEELLGHSNNIKENADTFKMHARSLQTLHEPFYKKILRFFSIFFCCIKNDAASDDEIVPQYQKPH